MNIADETLIEYSFLSRYHYTKSKNYLKRRYRIRHWIPMFIGTPCRLKLIFFSKIYSDTKGTLSLKRLGFCTEGQGVVSYWMVTLKTNSRHPPAPPPIQWMFISVETKLIKNVLRLNLKNLSRGSNMVGFT